MKRFLVALGLIGAFAGSAALVPFQDAAAINVFQGCSQGSNSGTEVCGAQREDSINPLVQTLINVLFFAIGIIAVIMIIVGGLKYVTSNGDSGRITSAKNTILYSVVGLVVAMLAYAIVGFVINAF